MIKTKYLFAFLILAVGIYLFWPGRGKSLVVYCAHDSIYSEKILRDFEKRTGIPVAIRFDTEATKSLGLVELIIREKDAPRCDLFWNNELIGTLDLQERGLLQPYKGSGYDRIPAAVKDPAGHWAGFAARLRVWIVNTNKLAATDDAISRELGDDLSRIAMAKPLYGTTLTHYSVLWELWGPERLKRWHASVRERGLHEVTGNAAVKNIVAEGVCALGITDSDDFFDALDDHKPVGMQPMRLPNGAVICIPNTVAIIRGTKRPGDAQKLVDFLLSAETELALAREKSRQIPLGPVPLDQLPADVRQLKEWTATQVPLTALGPARNACLAWLKTEYLK